jgi:hypothetical protein
MTQTIETLVFREKNVKKNLQNQVKGVQKDDNLVAKKAIRTNAFRPLLLLLFIPYFIYLIENYEYSRISSKRVV